MSASNLTCVSYIPLLWQGEELVEPASLQQVLDQPKLLARITGCTWVPSPEGNTFGLPCPLFVLQQCEKVVAHLLAWSRNAPGEWFTLVFEQDSVRYSASLTPNLDMSLARYFEEHPSMGADDLLGVRVVGFSLSFVSGVGGINTFRKVRPLFPERGVAGFVDLVDFDRTRPESTDPARIIWLGMFPYLCREKVKNVVLDRPGEEAARENPNVH